MFVGARMDRTPRRSVPKSVSRLARASKWATSLTITMRRSGIGQISAFQKTPE
jgi:hypothetical protein